MANYYGLTLPNNLFFEVKHKISTIRHLLVLQRRLIACWILLI